MTYGFIFRAYTPRQAICWIVAAWQRSRDYTMANALVGPRPAIIFATSAALITMFSACGDVRVGRIGGITGPTDTGAVAKIVVSPSSPSIAVGATSSFSALATNAAGKTVAATFSWQNSSPAVATINGSGVATAIGVGTTTITAVSGTVSGKATLTVTATSPP
jgi:hypothetical protein